MTFGFSLLTVGWLLLEAGYKGKTPLALLTEGVGTPGFGGVIGSLSQGIGIAFTGKGAETHNVSLNESGGKLTAAGLAAGVAKATSMSGMYPYVWGGGHQQIGKPSGGGYDCSGAVSAVLGAMGLLSRPETSGELMGWGLPGKGKVVTVYANPQHTFMRIGGLWFGTGSDKEAKRGGPAWGNHDPELGAYSARHPAEGRKEKINVPRTRKV